MSLIVSYLCRGLCCNKASWWDWLRKWHITLDRSPWHTSRSSPGPLEPSHVTQQVRKITSRRAVNSHRPRPMTHAMVPAACATMAKVGARLECRKALFGFAAARPCTGHLRNYGQARGQKHFTGLLHSLLWPGSHTSCGSAVAVNLVLLLLLHGYCIAVLTALRSATGADYPRRLIHV